MCGIFGVVNGKKSRKADRNIVNLIEQAFTVGALRGTDSTGLFQVDKGKIYVHKEPVHGALFAALDSTFPYIRDADTCGVLVAHNRAATQGAVSKENAHPFGHATKDETYFVGVHNGTLTNWDRTKFQVDSDWALRKIAAEGDAAYKNINGAFAFVFHDNRDHNTLHMVRNSERPLFAAFVENEDRMLFASEYMMLLWLADRNKIKLEKNIIDLTPGYRYSFDINNPRDYSTKKVDFFTSSSVYDDSDWGGWRSRRRHYPSSSVSYSAEDTAKRFTAKFIELLGPVDKPVDIAGVVTGPITGKGKKKDKSERNRYVSSEEVRNAKMLDELGGSVFFTPEMYDTDEKIVYGTATYVNGDTAQAIMRQVSQRTFDSLVLTDAAARPYMASVVGATTVNAAGEEDSSKNPSMRDLLLILSQNVVQLDPEDLKAFEDGAAAKINEYLNSRTVN